MTLTVIIVNDMSNPIEVQTWLTDHLVNVINHVVVQSNIFYVFYT